MLQQSKVADEEEIEKLKAQMLLEERERAATALLNKQPQKKPEVPEKTIVQPKPQMNQPMSLIDQQK